MGDPQRLLDDAVEVDQDILAQERSTSSSRVPWMPITTLHGLGSYGA